MTRRVMPGLALLSGTALAAACGSSGVDEKRTAFVEVTSSPSGLVVEIRLNNTTVEATTPIAQDVRYDALCTGVISGYDCLLFASAGVKGERAGQHLTLCVTDGGKRRCGTSDTGFVSVGLEFES